MKFIKNMLVSDEDCELKFKNDIGSRGEGMAYYAPSFFTSCFPAKSVDTIKKAKELFEEIRLVDKQACIDRCREEYDKKFPMPTIENSDKNIQEAKFTEVVQDEDIVEE